MIPVSTFGKKLDFSKYYRFAKKNELKILFDVAASHDPKIYQFKKNICIMPYKQKKDYI